MTALALNVALSDAGVLLGTSGVRFGDLTLYGYAQPGLNGQSVRSFLATASTALGGGATPYSLADLYDISESLDGSFEGGTVSSYAQEHLAKGTSPSNQCPTASALIVSTHGLTANLQLQGQIQTAIR